MLAKLKLWLGQAGIGATLAIVGAVFLGPGFIAWRYEPPDQTQLSCAPAVRSALQSLARFELWAAGVGGVVGIVLAQLVKRRNAVKGDGEMS